MKKKPRSATISIAYPLVFAFGVLPLIASCGMEAENSPFDSVGSYAKVKDNKKNTPSEKHDNTKMDKKALEEAWEEAWEDVWNDISKDKKKTKKFKESFEGYAPGSPARQDNIWVSAGAGYAEVTDSESSRGDQSLQVGIAENSTGYDYIALKFCLNEPVVDFLSISFSIKFDNLVNWTGMGILSHEDTLQYWFWIRENGTVFNGHTFDKFVEGVWQNITMQVDRKMNMVTFILDGNENYFDLSQEWTKTDPTQPMRCLFYYLGVLEAPQTLYVDDIYAIGL